MKIKVKAAILIPAILILSACLRPPVHTSATEFDSFSFDEVWAASLRALHDIDFIPYTVDRRAGYITAEMGHLMILHDVPPQISILISREYGKTFVDCKVTQLDQYVDIFGLNKKITRNFYMALHDRLRRLGENDLL
jgi:hypothetical protein